MARRAGSLLGTVKAAADQVAAEAVAQPPAPAAAPAAGTAKRRFKHDTARMTTTAIHIPHEALALLRLVAVQRANREGGRPSVSAVLTEMVEQQRAALEREAKGG